MKIQRRFTEFLIRPRRQTEDRFRSDASVDDDQLRRFVVDQVLEWGSHRGTAGIWLEYVDKVRPGTEAGLFECLPTAASVLRSSPCNLRVLPPRRLPSQQSAISHHSKRMPREE